MIACMQNDYLMFGSDMEYFTHITSNINILCQGNIIFLSLSMRKLRDSLINELKVTNNKCKT
jgi:hypothetical protein